MVKRSDLEVEVTLKGKKLAGNFTGRFKNLKTMEARKMHFNSKILDSMDQNTTENTAQMTVQIDTRVTFKLSRLLTLAEIRYNKSIKRPVSKVEEDERERLYQYIRDMFTESGPEKDVSLIEDLGVVLAWIEDQKSKNIDADNPHILFDPDMYKLLERLLNFIQRMIL